jgi:zinc transporter ZupT
MTSANLGVRIGAMFVIFIVSCIGFMTPIRSKNESMETPVRVCMKACGAGVMLGIALIHLVPDAHADLTEVVPDYNLAFAVVTIGILLVVSIEQVAIIVATGSGEQVPGKKSVEMCPVVADDHSHSHDHGSGIGHRHGHDHDHHDHGHEEPHHHHHHNEEVHHHEDCGLKKCDCPVNDLSPPGTPHRVASVGLELVACTDPDHDPTCHVHVESHCAVGDRPALEVHCHHDLALTKRLMSGDSVRDIVMVYALELSIAIHSIIIGVDIGLLSHRSDMVTLLTLIVAISFHQYIEGFSVGVSVLAASDTITREGGVSLVGTDRKVLMFVLIFSTTVPLGILIGILSSGNEETESGVMAKGCANALAAGSLLYISLAEMIGPDFSRAHLRTRPMLRLAMLGSLTAGVLFTAVLAIWA